MPESYFPLDVNFFDHPKIVGLSDASLRMYLASIAYANRLMTDGHVADAVIGRFIEWDWNDPEAMTPDRCAAELVKAELWHPADVSCPAGVPAGQDGTCPSFPFGGYRIHDFLAHNRSRADRLAARDKERDRKAAYRQRRQTGTDPDNPPPRDGGVLPSVPPGHHRPRDVPGTVNTETETETETEVPPSAGRASPTATAPPPTVVQLPTAQTLVAAYVDAYRVRAGHDPPSRIKGQLARELGQLLRDGVPVEHVRAGLAAWFEENKHPSTLASFVEVEARGGQPRASPARSQQRLDQARRTYEEMMADAARGSAHPDQLALDRGETQPDLGQRPDQQGDR
jgi:hypothetical protein